jgi:hypothetical protein
VQLSVDCNTNNTFTWSGPSGVVGFTGQPRVARSEHCALLSQPGPVGPLRPAPKEPTNDLSRKGIGSATPGRAPILLPLSRCTCSLASCPTWSRRVTPGGCLRFRPIFSRFVTPAIRVDCTLRDSWKGSQNCISCFGMAFGRGWELWLGAVVCV